METTYYTLTAREILVEGAAVQQASGGARQLVCVRKAGERPSVGGGKVIDMSAWKADREEEARLEELWYDGVDEALEGEPVRPEPRVRKARGSALNLELWTSLAVVGVMAVLLIRIFAGV